MFINSLRGSFVFAFLFFSINCLGQSVRPEFQLSTNFEPSFSKKGRLTISKTLVGNFIRIEVFEDPEFLKTDFKEEGKVKDEVIDDLASYLEQYNFSIKGNIDTIGIERVLRNRDSVTAYVISMGLDGITVNGKFTSASSSRNFAFWSPKKDTQNHKLIEKILAISNTSFRKKRTLKYIKTLERYFE